MSEELKAIQAKLESNGSGSISDATWFAILDRLTAAEARAEAAEARVGELEAALKPFVEFQQASIVSYRNYSDADHFYTFNETSITVGDLRNATRTLKGTHS